MLTNAATVLVLCLSLFGQDAVTSSPPTFHVEGTIKDPLGALIPGAEIDFEGSISRATSADHTAHYQLDLPLGSYVMKVERKGFHTYNRPTFCVLGPEHLTFDVMLHVWGIIDRIVIGSKSPEDFHWPEFDTQSFSVPSMHCPDARVAIDYPHAETVSGGFRYSGRKVPYDDPVVVAYGLDTLVADNVIYAPKQQMITATGNVALSDAAGKTCTSDSLTLKIKHGRMIPRRPC